MTSENNQTIKKTYQIVLHLHDVDLNISTAGTQQKTSFP